MRMRHEVQNRQLLYKCQGVVNGDEIIVQLRSWERDHTNPLLTVKLVGVDAPPLGEEDDPAVIAYAEACGMQPAFASKMGKSSHHALLAFLRKQNLSLVWPNGEHVHDPVTTNLTAHAFVFGSDVGRKQIQSGLARHDATPEQAYAAEYAEAQETAQEIATGIWSKR